LELGGVKLPRVIGRYAEDRKGAFSSRTEAGTIGNEVLANFVLDFDYGNERIWFDPCRDGMRHPSPAPA